MIKQYNNVVAPQFCGAAIYGGYHLVFKYGLCSW